MAYKLLGMAVWKGAKLFLRRRYGDKPRKVLAGGLVAFALVGLLMAGRRAAS